MTDNPYLDPDYTARLAAEELLDEGWGRSIIVEPLTALAGGIVGGTLVAALAWRTMWRHARPTRRP